MKINLTNQLKKYSKFLIPMFQKHFENNQKRWKNFQVKGIKSWITLLNFSNRSIQNCFKNIIKPLLKYRNPSQKTPCGYIEKSSKKIKNKHINWIQPLVIKMSDFLLPPIGFYAGEYGSFFLILQNRNYIKYNILCKLQ